MMNTLTHPATKTNSNTGWMILFIVALLQAVAAFFLLLGSGPTTFEADTGVAWAELARVFPTVAVQFEMAQQASLVGNLAIGLLCLLISYFALREGQRWAWFALWILPDSMVPGTLSLLRTENQAGAAVFGVHLFSWTLLGC
jgi:hypothetical protein